MDNVFDYDVFLSFAAADEEIVRPIWQELCLSGLRVFWSDATLKEKVGERWIDTIQSSLVRSRHFLLIATRSSMISKWVKLEYGAFMALAGGESSRRLIPLIVGDYPLAELHPFLGQMQAARLDAPRGLKDIIQLLGGTDVEQLKQLLLEKERENKELSEKVRIVVAELGSLKQQFASPEELERRLLEKEQENKELSEKLITTTAELDSLNQRLSSLEGLERRLPEKEQENKELSEKLITTTAELDSLNRRLSSLEGLERRLLEKEQENKELSEELITTTAELGSLNQRLASLRMRIESVKPRSKPTSADNVVTKTGGGNQEKKKQKSVPNGKNSKPMRRGVKSKSGLERPAGVKPTRPTKRRHMSPASRKRIAEMMKQRWAERKEGGRHQIPAVGLVPGAFPATHPATQKKRTIQSRVRITPVERKRISEEKRKRWDEWKRRGMTSIPPWST